MEQEVATDITITDMKLMVQVIEACTARGAFRAKELAPVGDLYDKITKCLINIGDGDTGNKKP